jgi:hypothetical protein
MNTMATVIFWAALVWTPGLVLMVYLLLPRRRRQPD